MGYMWKRRCESDGFGSCYAFGIKVCDGLDKLLEKLWEIKVDLVKV